MRVEGVISCKNGQNVRVGERLFVSAGCEFIDDGVIDIAADVILGERVRLIATENADVTIGKGVWIGDGAELRPGACIGDGAMVCADSVVEGEVPANALADGRPAKVTWYLR